MNNVTPMKTWKTVQDLWWNPRGLGLPDELELSDRFANSAKESEANTPIDEKLAKNKAKPLPYVK